MLSKFVPWLKLVPPILIALLLALLVFQTNQIKHVKGQLTNERDARHELSVKVGAEDNWPSIRAHTDAIIKTSANRKVTLDTISRDALANKVRSDELDLQLKQQQAENDRRYAKASQHIKDLEARRGTGNPDVDRKTISDDSKAAWTGWNR